MRLFVDTSAFLALEDRDDRNHESAVEFRNSLQNGGTPYKLLYTTNYIFDETITLFRAELGHTAAVSFGEGIKSSKLVTILWISQELDTKAWNIFKKHKDKGYSYTDCTSFAVMKEEEIDSVFAYDKHFSQYGFQSVR
jgi:predicted nucleic acid-binding protein